MTDILREIIAHKQAEIAQLDGAVLKRAAFASPTPRDFRAAVRRPQKDLPPRLIAELKLASPSKGALAPKLNVTEVSQIYVENGAAAISVLTDSRYFQGKLSTLRTLRDRPMPLPLLRKDFIIDEAQVYESRAHGADAILLIVAAFDDPSRLERLHALALDLELTPLVEVHDEREVQQALRIRDIGLIGINNRDLATFRTRLETTEELRPMIPADIPVISESGIFTGEHVKRLASADVDAVLVGEALVTAADIALKVQELAGMQVKAHD